MKTTTLTTVGELKEVFGLIDTKQFNGMGDSDYVWVNSDENGMLSLEKSSISKEILDGFGHNVENTKAWLKTLRAEKVAA